MKVWVIETGIGESKVVAVAFSPEEAIACVHHHYTQPVFWTDYPDGTVGHCQDWRGNWSDIEFRFKEYEVYGPGSSRVCPHCAKTFYVGVSTGRRGDAKFCSKEHQRQFNSLKRSRPLKGRAQDVQAV